MNIKEIRGTGFEINAVDTYIAKARQNWQGNDVINIDELHNDNFPKTKRSYSIPHVKAIIELLIKKSVAHNKLVIIAKSGLQGWDSNLEAEKLRILDIIEKDSKVKFLDADSNAKGYTKKSVDRFFGVLSTRLRANNMRITEKTLKNAKFNISANSKKSYDANEVNHLISQIIDYLYAKSL